MNTKRLNFDTNASLNLLPEVKEFLLSDPRFLSQSLLNPSSIHQDGQFAKSLIEEARDNIRELLGFKEGEARIVFTSGATESNNMAMMIPFWQQAFNRKKGNASSSITLLNKDKDPYILASAYEHPCVLEPLKRLENLNIQHELISVNTVNSANNFSQHFSFLPTLEKNLQLNNSNCSLATCHYVNNETGDIFDIANIFAEVKKFNPHILCHTDMVQALGKIDFKFLDLNADLASISGHKIGALQGVGALILKEDLEHSSLILGGAQEKRFRAGTENTLGIITFGIAAKVLKKTLIANIKNAQKTKDFLLQELYKICPQAKLNSIFSTSNLTSTLNLSLTSSSSSNTVAANTINLRLPNVNASDFLIALDLQGINISTGSACASGKPLPSHVLMALGLSEIEAKECIRISFDVKTTIEQALEFLQRFEKCYKTLKL